MAWCTIEPADWSTFFTRFSGQHQGWLVRPGGTLDQFGAFDHAGAYTSANDAGDSWWSLRELRYEREREGGEIVVVLGAPERDGDGEASGSVKGVEIRVAEPRRVAVEQTAAGVERAVAFAGWGGRLTLRLRRAIAPERVDGPIGRLR